MDHDLVGIETDSLPSGNGAHAVCTCGWQGEHVTTGIDEEAWFLARAAHSRHVHESKDA